MGAWGVHFDECDGSLDFLGDVAESRNWDDVRYRIRDYAANGGYDDAEEAIAALELVAAARGNASTRLRSDLAEWAGKQSIDTSDGVIALAAVDLVDNNSELNELWAEADEGGDWKATIADLRSRLQAR